MKTFTLIFDMTCAVLALLCILLFALVVSAIGSLTPIGGDFKWTCGLCWDALTGLPRAILDLYRWERLWK